MFLKLSSKENSPLSEKSKWWNIKQPWKEEFYFPSRDKLTDAFVIMKWFINQQIISWKEVWIADIMNAFEIWLLPYYFPYWEKWEHQRYILNWLKHFLAISLLSVETEQIYHSWFL